MEYKLSDASIMESLDFYSSTLDNTYYRNRSSFNGRSPRAGDVEPQPKKKASKKPKTKMGR